MKEIFEKIYDNIGSKMKSIGKALFIAISGIFILMGLIMMFLSPVAGIVMILLGPVLAWLSSLTICAFGELVETNSQIKEFTKEIAESIKFANTQPSGENTENNT